jgi:hypothetical protein
MGSKPARTTGIVLTAVGAAFGGLGLTVGLLMLSKSSELGDASNEDRAAAFGVAGLGAAAFVTGLVLLSGNRTSITWSSPPPRGFALVPGGFTF